MDQWPKQFTKKVMFVYGHLVSTRQLLESKDNASECLKSIVKDESVQSAVEIVHGDLVHVRFLARNIREKASSISKAIQNEDYDRDASRCSTYLTIPTL